MSVIVAIDQSPCRASYGLNSSSDFLSITAARQRQTVRENIARTVANGDRMARIGNNENAILAIASEAYLAENPPREVTLVQIDRPTYHLAEISGGLINIFV